MRGGQAPCSITPPRRQNRTSLPCWPVLSLTGGGGGVHEWGNRESGKYAAAPGELAGSDDGSCEGPGHRAHLAQHLPVPMGHWDPSGKAPAQDPMDKEARIWKDKEARIWNHLGSGPGPANKSEGRELSLAGRPHLPEHPSPCSLTRPLSTPHLDTAGDSHPFFLNLSK